jgi:hypothetical protein
MLLCVMAGVGKLPYSSHNMPIGEANAVCLVTAVSSIFCVCVLILLTVSIKFPYRQHVTWYRIG